MESLNGSGLGRNGFWRETPASGRRVMGISRNKDPLDISADQRIRRRPSPKAADLRAPAARRSTASPARYSATGRNIRLRRYASGATLRAPVLASSRLGKPRPSSGLDVGRGERHGVSDL